MLGNQPVLKTERGAIARRNLLTITFGAIWLIAYCFDLSVEKVAHASIRLDQIGTTGIRLQLPS